MYSVSLLAGSGQQVLHVMLIFLLSWSLTAVNGGYYTKMINTCVNNTLSIGTAQTRVRYQYSEQIGVRYQYSEQTTRVSYHYSEQTRVSTNTVSRQG